MTKAEDEVYQMIFNNGKQNLSQENDSVKKRRLFHEFSIFYILCLKGMYLTVN